MCHLMLSFQLLVFSIYSIARKMIVDLKFQNKDEKFAGEQNASVADNSWKFFPLEIPTARSERIKDYCFEISNRQILKALFSL